jgi:hypothetical protein
MDVKSFESLLFTFVNFFNSPLDGPFSAIDRIVPEAFGLSEESSAFFFSAAAAA